MTDTATNELILPGLRGSMGDWIYYSALMRATDLIERVSYAREVHRSELLSEWIQRQLEGTRAARIAKYLKDSPQRFFNSLVIAVYDGAPRWIEIGDVRLSADPEVEESIAKSAVRVVGFLHLSGEEKMFALDGQHRLAGFKSAAKKGMDLSKELVSVILVGHKEDAVGRVRTRRLFTTLNKTAVSVSKKDIIALDEDDSMAITSRALVEKDKRFKPPRVAITTAPNLGPDSTDSFTTIGTLYDCLLQLFLQTSKKKKRDLRFNRPEDSDLDTRYEEATRFFDVMAQTFPAVKDFFAAKEPEKVVATARNRGGGHILFRPIGLVMITKLAVALSKRHQVDVFNALEFLDDIPTDLSEAPYVEVIWNPRSRTMMGKNSKLALDLLAYMCHLPTKKDQLLKKYQGVVGEEAELPDRIASFSTIS